MKETLMSELAAPIARKAVDMQMQPNVLTRYAGIQLLRVVEPYIALDRNAGGTVIIKKKGEI